MPLAPSLESLCSLAAMTWAALLYCALAAKRLCLSTSERQRGHEPWSEVSETLSQDDYPRCLSHCRHLTRISSLLCWEALGASLDKLPEGGGLLRQRCFSDQAGGIIGLYGKIFTATHLKKANKMVSVEIMLLAMKFQHHHCHTQMAISRHFYHILHYCGN